MGQNLVMTGMVLNAMPIGDYDKRITLLTRERGKITAFARGARKPNSQFLAATNPFSFGEFELFEGRSTYTVAKVSIQNYFRELAADFNAAYYGFYFLEFADYYTRENADCMDYMKLVYQSLRALLIPAIPRKLVRYIYELKAMVYSGECPQDWEQFESWNADTSTRYAFQFVIAPPVEKLYTFTLSEEVCEEFGRIVTYLRRHYVEHPFKSLEILETCL